MNSPTKLDSRAANHAATHSDKRDELRLLINSRHPILTIETTEEDRRTG